MTGIDIVKYYMSIEEQSRFMVNLFKIKSFNECADYMTSEWLLESDIISCAFEWDKTEEGHKYWENIYLRILNTKSQLN